MIDYLKKNYDIFLLFCGGAFIMFYFATLIYNIENFDFEKDCYDYYINTGYKLNSCRRFFK